MTKSISFHPSFHKHWPFFSCLLVTITKTAELLLTGSVPRVEDDRTKVRVESKRVDFDTKSGCIPKRSPNQHSHLKEHKGNSTKLTNIFLFEFTSQMALDKGGLTGTTVADWFYRKKKTRSEFHTSSQNESKWMTSSARSNNIPRTSLNVAGSDITNQVECEMNKKSRASALLIPDFPLFIKISSSVGGPTDVNGFTLPSDRDGWMCVKG